MMRILAIILWLCAVGLAVNTVLTGYGSFVLLGAPIAALVTAGILAWPGGFKGRRRFRVVLIVLLLIAGSVGTAMALLFVHGQTLVSWTLFIIPIVAFVGAGFLARSCATKGATGPKVALLVLLLIVGCLGIALAVMIHIAGTNPCNAFYSVTVEEDEVTETDGRSEAERAARAKVRDAQAALENAKCEAYRLRAGQTLQ
jgi:hypothetical protein